MILTFNIILLIAITGLFNLICMIFAIYLIFMIRDELKKKRYE